MLDPSLFLVIDDLLETDVGNSFFVLGYLLLVPQEEKSVLRHNDITIYIDSIIILFYVALISSCHLIFHTQMLSGVLVEPCIVTVILLLHEALLNNDSENVGDDANGDEDPSVEVHLCEE